MKNGVIKDITKKLINNQKIILKNKGRHQADFIYIDDCINLIEKLAFSKVDGEINIGSGRATKIYNLTKKLAKICSIKNNNIKLLERDKKDFRGYFPIDLKDLQSIIKFKPTKLNDGLSKMFKEKNNQ